MSNQIHLSQQTHCLFLSPTVHRTSFQSFQSGWCSALITYLYFIVPMLHLFIRVNGRFLSTPAIYWMRVGEVLKASPRGSGRGEVIGGLRLIFDLWTLTDDNLGVAKFIRLLNMFQAKNIYVLNAIRCWIPCWGYPLKIFLWCFFCWFPCAICLGYFNELRGHWEMRGWPI